MRTSFENKYTYIQRNKGWTFALKNQTHRTGCCANLARNNTQHGLTFLFAVHVLDGLYSGRLCLLCTFWMFYIRGYTYRPRCMGFSLILFGCFIIRGYTYRPRCMGFSLILMYLKSGLRSGSSVQHSCIHLTTTSGHWRSPVSGRNGITGSRGSRTCCKIPE